MIMGNKLLSVLLAVPLFFCGATSQCAAAVKDVPPSSLKVPPMVAEKSVSTFVPSETAGEQGLAVNIIYPAKPRYSEGAPLVVVIPGGVSSDGLDFSMHAAQAGFAEVRFAFPGGGKPGFQSGGSFDYRGPQSAVAVRDILLFASGQKNDYQGRNINDLVPVRLATGNLGMVGWSNGGNLLLATLGKFASELSAVKWIAFNESPVGALFFPPFLGSSQDLILNRHYRQGSCATGSCLLDMRKLAWLPEGQKSPGSHRRIGEPEVRGILFFDENRNKQWDELTEYAFPYAGYPGFDKQFYPPVVVRAADRFKLFEVTRRVEEKKKKKEEEGKDDKRGGRRKKYDDDDKKSGEGKGFLGIGKKKDDKKKDEPVKMETVILWPPTLATVAESEKYFQDRDGSLFLTEVCQKMPKLLVVVYGSRTDHLQGQPDHPHITYLYNTLLANKIWVRLNPDPLYVGQISVMNSRNFIDNKPNVSIDSALIEPHLEPEGLVPDYVFMDAAIAEMADRLKTNKPNAAITEPLVNYSNGAEPPKEKEGIKPEKSGK